MEIKDIALKAKAFDNAGAFVGMGALYNEVDLQGDIIQPGAFSKTIREQGEGKVLLWAHDMARPIGLAKLEDSDRGLVVRGTIDRDDADGAAAFNRVQKGYVRGLSIGFDLPNAGAVSYQNGKRYLGEVRVHELSLVSVPAQPAALISGVKSLSQVASWLAGVGVEQLGEEVHRELRGLQTAIKRLLPEQASSNPVPLALLADLRELAMLARGRG